MSRRYRFLTNPRLFSFFTEPRMNLVEFFVTFVVASTGLTFLFLHYDSEQDRIRESTLEARVEKARSEVQLLKAEAKRKGTPLSTPASLKGSSETETQTPAVHARNHSDVPCPTTRWKLCRQGLSKGCRWMSPRKSIKNIPLRLWRVQTGITNGTFGEGTTKKGT